MDVNASYRFGREMRLRTPTDFARVKQEGRRAVKGCLIANWLQETGSDSLRLGVITPKSIGAAPERARARRLMRESFRLNQRRLRRPLTLVLIARPSIAGKAMAEVERDFLILMGQAGLLAEK